MATINFASSVIASNPVTSVISVTLPSGVFLPGIQGWGKEQFDFAISRNPSDAEALYSIQASLDLIVNGLRNQDNEVSTVVPVNPDVVVTPVPEPTAYNVFTSEYDPDPAPYAREIGAPVPGDGTETGLSEPPTNEDPLGQFITATGVGLKEPPTNEDPFEQSRLDAAASLKEANPTEKDVQNFINAKKSAVKNTPKESKPRDWRVRISLAPNANYLYAADEAGILSPLKNTKGVVFPYTPTIQVNYSAKYESVTPTHSNFAIHNYQNSSVDGLTITGEFTAQSVTEANYVLAVIHFFKSATKMFYGKDAQRGTPPPLLYLTGYGQYQFDNHPMVLTSFNYSLPQDVDYVDAYSMDEGSASTAINGVSLSEIVQPARGSNTLTNFMDSAARLLSGKKKIAFGGGFTPNSFKTSPDSVKSITRVPSKISITLTLHPMITRQAINDHFSLKDYATGKLLRSTNKGTGGGIW